MAGGGECWLRTQVLSQMHADAPAAEVLPAGQAAHASGAVDVA